MSANSLVEGNDRCPHAPTRYYHKTSGNWFYRVLFYPRKGGKGTRKDLYARDLPGDLDPWKTEDEMKQYQVAIWNAFKHNKAIVLDAFLFSFTHGWYISSVLSPWFLVLSLRSLFRP